MKPEPTTRRRRIAASVAVATMAAGGLGVLASGALFTDTEAVGGNVFSAGTVDLTASPASAAIGMTAMAPGDVSYGTITVENSGSLAYRYSFTTTTEDGEPAGMGAELAAAVKVGATCTSTDFAGTGTSLYSGSLDGAGAGDPAAGAQAGDRELAATDSETLCFRVELPITAGNDVQGASTTAMVTFSAEQVKNNP